MIERFSYMIEVCGSNQRVPCLESRQAIGCPMPDTYLNDRPVYFGDVHFNGVDSYFESACYADTLEDLDTNELDQLGTECADYLVEGSIEKFGYFRK